MKAATVSQEFAAKFATEKEALRTQLETTKRSELWRSLMTAARKDLEARGRIRYVATDMFVEPQEGDDSVM